MAEMPWVKWYVDDHLVATEHLSAAEEGAYVRLLAHCWRRGGWLDLDMARLARLVKMAPEEFRAAWDGALRDLFLVSEDGTKIANRRMLEELGQAVERSAKGVRGAKKRWVNDAKPMPERCPSDARGDAQSMLESMPERCSEVCSDDAISDLRSQISEDQISDPDPDRRLTPAVEDSLSLVPDEPEPAPKPKRVRKTELPPGFFNACLSEFCVGWSAVYGERYVPQPDELGLLRSFLGRLPEEHRDQWGQRLARYFADTTRYNVAERRHSLKAFVTGEAWNKYAVSVVAWKTPRQQEAENAAAQFLAGTDDLALEEPAPRKKLGGVL